MLNCPGSVTSRPRGYMKKFCLPLIACIALVLSACASIDNHSSSPSFASGHNGQARRAPAVAQSKPHHQHTQLAKKQSEAIDDKDLAHKIQDSAKKVGTKISSAGSAIISVLSDH